MFCHNCGSPISFNENFCHECGCKNINSFQPEINVKTKGKKTKYILFAVCFIIIAAIFTAISIIHINNKENSDWYMSKQIIDGLIYEERIEYFDAVQIKSIESDNSKIVYNYNKDNHLSSVETGDAVYKLKYNKKGSKTVGTSDTSESLYFVAKYNKDNKPVLLELYKANRIHSSDRFEYDPAGRLVKKTSIDNNGCYSISTFDKNGLLINFVLFNPDGSLRYKCTYEYNGKRQIGMKYYDSDERLYIEETLTSESKNEIKTTQYDKNGNILWYISYEYDENDNLIERKRYNKNNKLSEQVSYRWEKG